MKKKKQQQVISRFFAPKPPPSPSPPSPSPPPPPPSSSKVCPFPSPSPSPSPSLLGVEWPPKGSLTRQMSRESPSSSNALHHLQQQRNGSTEPTEECHEYSEEEPYKKRLKQQTTTEETEKLVLDMGSSLGTKMESSRVEREISLLPPIDPMRHQKFLNLLLPRTRNSLALHEEKEGKSSCGNEKYTPLEQQVVELKSKYRDIVLMVEVGYRYRFFGEDAEIAARVLGIFAHNDHNFLTASIPTFRLNVHVRRLVEAGYKVGVVRQTETAAIKAHGVNKMGPFSRSLSALYTRATIEAAEDLGGGEASEGGGRLNSYLFCITEQPKVFDWRSKKEGNPPQKRGEKSNQISSEEQQLSEHMGKGHYDTVIGIVAVETSTGDVMYSQFEDTVLRGELEACLLSCSPAELLVATPLSSATEKLLVDFAGPASNIRMERVSCDRFSNGGALPEVLTFYGGKDSEQGTPQEDGKNSRDAVDKGVEAVLEMPELVLQALALALGYLKEFGLERVLRLGASFRPFCTGGEMKLSCNTLRQLEILQNNADGTGRGSLLCLMDHTHTPSGARLLRYWLAHPLRDRVLISARLDAVSEIAEYIGSTGYSQYEGSFPGSGKGGGCVGAASRGHLVGAKDGQGQLSSVLITLRKMPDLERGITRIFHRTATAAEFVSVVQSLITVARQLQRLNSVDDDDDEDNVELDSKPGNKEGKKGIRSPLLRRLVFAASSSVVSEKAVKLLSCLNKEAAIAGDKCNLFVCADGKFTEVGKCKEAVVATEERLDSFLPHFRKTLKMPNLQYTTFMGTTHLLEVPVAQRVPGDWVKVCATQKLNRFHAPEVLEALESLALANEQLRLEGSKAWNVFLAEFATHYAEFRSAVQSLAAIDCLHSLAVLSKRQGYTRPEFGDQSEPWQLTIEGGRHPVLESTLQEGFVPNDTYLHARKERCQIITGPNMGGKSCYIRQVAMIVIMAQVGSYVPAAYAKLNVFDAIYTRMGASDSLQRGSSTFLEELSETSVILRKATPQSLVIVDELGRGTSTHDGVAIAYATLHFLLQNIGCLVLFVTHYLKLVELKQKYDTQIGSYFVSYLADLSQSTESEALMVKNMDILPNEETQTVTKAKEVAQSITFLYKLVKGVASRSFGLHVARLAQIPEVCVQRAAFMAAKLEKEVRAHSNLKPEMEVDNPRYKANSGKVCSDDVCEGEANLSNIRIPTEDEGNSGGRMGYPNEKEVRCEEQAIKLSAVLLLVRKAISGNADDVVLSLKKAKKQADSILEEDPEYIIQKMPSFGGDSVENAL